MSTIRERIRQEEEQAQVDACYDGLEMRPVYEAYSRGELLPADEIEDRVTDAVAAERERCAQIAENYVAASKHFATKRAVVLTGDDIAAAIREADDPR